MKTLSSVPSHPGSENKKVSDKRGFLFYLVVFSLLVEFGRPQDIIPGLGLIPFPSVIDFLIGLSVVMSGKLTFDKPQTKLWIALFVIMGIHVPIATNNFWAAMTLKDMLLIFLFYLGLTTYVETIDKLKSAVNAWVSVHVVLAVTGLINKGHGAGGWLGDENDLCMELNVAVPFAYFLLMNEKNPRKKMIYLGMLCVFVLAAMVTISRGGFIGLASVGMYCWFKSPNKGRSLGLIGLVIIFMFIFAPEEYWQEVQSSTDEQTMSVGTGAERLYTWGISWQMFLQHPIIGVGQGNFPWNFEEAQGNERFNTRSLAGRAAHSMYFTLLPELGLAGITIFGMMLLANHATIRKARQIANRLVLGSNRLHPTRENDPEFCVAVSNALEAAIVGYLVSSVFISTLYYPTFWVLTGLVVTLGNVMMQSSHTVDSNSSASRPGKQMVLPRKSALGFRGKKMRP